MAEYWYEPGDMQAEADGQQRQPEWPQTAEFNLPTYTDDDAPDEIGFSDEEQALIDRVNEIKAITDSLTPKTEDTL